MLVVKAEWRFSMDGRKGHKFWWYITYWWILIRLMRLYQVSNSWELLEIFKFSLTRIFSKFLLIFDSESSLKSDLLRPKIPVIFRKNLERGFLFFLASSLFAMRVSIISVHFLLTASKVGVSGLFRCWSIIFKLVWILLSSSVFNFESSLNSIFLSGYS